MQTFAYLHSQHAQSNINIRLEFVLFLLANLINLNPIITFSLSTVCSSLTPKKRIHLFSMLNAPLCSRDGFYVGFVCFVRGRGLFG